MRDRTRPLYKALARSLVLIVVALAFFASEGGAPYRDTQVLGISEVRERMRAMTQKLRAPAARLRAGPTKARPAPRPRRRPPRRTRRPTVPKTPAVSVLDFGALADGVANDTKAIQAANDEVAALGGGIVRFPPGVYLAMGIQQDSRVEFRGTDGAILRHPDGVSGQPIIHSRVRRTAGSIAEGSKTLRVSEPAPISKGGLVAIRAAGGPSSTQYSELALPVTAELGVFTLRSAKGFSTGSTIWPNHLLVDDEIISYRRLAGETLVDVQRGLFGTTPANHAEGTRIAQVMVLYAEVKSVDGDEVSLDRPATLGVVQADVTVGSLRPAIKDLMLDGNRKADQPGSNPFPVIYELVRSASISGSTFVNGADGGALRLDRGTRGSVVENNSFVDNGGMGDKGASIWMFRGASGNVIRNNEILSGSSNGVVIDDRTVTPTEWDGSAAGNLVERNVIDIPVAGGNSAVAIFGSSDNTVRANVLNGTIYGVRVYSGGQGAFAPPTSGNLVEGNQMVGHRFGIWADGSNNRSRNNTFADVSTHFVDKGTGNLLT